MPGIHVLPVHLVNKIAAGEVIERPASIVKELVENALDARATRIEVTIEDGGKRLVAVSDNGAGMDAQDLALAFAPHATSKITGEDDLLAITTMGFRGEALASIASVSHAHIRTRVNPALRSKEDAGPADESGYELEAGGEMLGAVRPCASAGGTTVTIRDLFFNTPARRKFMKTANTELGHITEQLIRLALPHPQVAFSLTHNGRTIQDLPAGESTLQRVTDIFGQEIAHALLPIRQRSSGQVSVAGLAAKPQAARASGNWQYFFLNGRYVRDRLLSHALKEAYRGLVDPSRWPVAMVFLQVDPAEVDVNVHPTKIEVRFRDGQRVHSELLAALRDTLNRADLTPSALGGAAAPADTPSTEAGRLAPADNAEARHQALSPDDTATAGQDVQQEQRRQSLREAMADFFKSARPQPRLGFGELPPSAKLPREAGRHASANDADASRPPPATEVEQENYLGSPQAASSAEGAAAASLLGTSSAIQIHSSYIVAPVEDGLIIVDQHALHERLIYNDLKRRLASGAVTSQRLLIPQTLSVSQAQALALEEHGELLGSLGIELTPFGPGALAVQSFPLLLVQRGVDPAAFLREILDLITEAAHTGRERILEGLLETMACKAAVKAGDPLTVSEMDELLRRRVEADKGSSCPHGRPTTLTLTLKDLQKQFKRT